MDTKKSTSLRALLGSVLLGVALNASAATFIQGTLGMGGGFSAVDSNFIATSLDQATGIDFQPNSFRVASSSTGDFASLSGTIGSIQDFQFAPSTFTPITNFWSAGLFTFDMTSVAQLATADPTQFISLQGQGTMKGSGFLDTQGSWSFSGNALSGTFSWSAGSTAVGVPEPMALALIGIGLVGFSMRGMYRRAS